MKLLEAAIHRLFHRNRSQSTAQLIEWELSQLPVKYPASFSGAVRLSTLITFIWEGFQLFHFHSPGAGNGSVQLFMFFVGLLVSHLQEKAYAEGSENTQESNHKILI